MFQLAPAVHATRETRIAKLFDGSLHLLVEGVTDAIYTGFQAEGVSSKAVPYTEKQRRFAICMDWAVILRGDLEWGVQRIVGAMPEILKTELTGTKWTPHKRQCWIPQDGK